MRFGWTRQRREASKCTIENLRAAVAFDRAHCFQRRRYGAKVTGDLHVLVDRDAALASLRLPIDCNARIVRLSLIAARIAI